MNESRRKWLSLTAAGLIHVAANRQPAGADEAVDTGLLIHRAAQRGHTDLNWLTSYHSFSFGEFYDQQRMGFRSLRVINDDRIVAGRGFPTHPHRNMEIISYVLEGALQHRDSTGRGAIIKSDDIQMMSAGTGITHSEFNPSRNEANHFLQIWIKPGMRGMQPRYRENKVTIDEKINHWKKIAGPEDSQASVALRQDATIYATHLQAGNTIDFTVQRGRHAWLQLARGELVVNGTTLTAGDAIASSRATSLHVRATLDTDALLFDLA